MNTNRRHVLHLATTALALPDRALATVTERSGSADRKVTRTTFWRNTLSCDNAGVPVSQRNGRLAAPADFGGAQQYAGDRRAQLGCPAVPSCDSDRQLTGGQFGTASDSLGSASDIAASDLTGGKLPPKLSDRRADVRGRQ